MQNVCKSMHQGPPALGPQRVPRPGAGSRGRGLRKFCNPVLVALFAIFCNPLLPTPSALPAQEPPAPDTVALLVAYQVQVPTPIHIVVGGMVDICLERAGYERRVGPATVWASAELVVFLPSRAVLYGVAHTSTGPGDPDTVVIEERYWLNPSILSHELLHLAGLEHGDSVMARCTIPTGVNYPTRELLPGALKELLSRDDLHRVRIGR